MGNIFTETIKMVAVNFAEWITINGYYQLRRQEWTINVLGEENKIYTSEQLYELFLESENKRLSGIKTCKKCGHEICPHCGDWCDTLLLSKQQKGNHEGAESDDDYPIPCCNGKCEF